MDYLARETGWQINGWGPAFIKNFSSTQSLLLTPDKEGRATSVFTT